MAVEKAEERSYGGQLPGERGLSTPPERRWARKERKSEADECLQILERGREAQVHGEKIAELRQVAAIGGDGVGRARLASRSPPRKSVTAAAASPAAENLSESIVAFCAMGVSLPANA